MARATNYPTQSRCANLFFYHLARGQFTPGRERFWIGKFFASSFVCVMRPARLFKLRSVRFRLFTMKLMFALFLILQTARASSNEIFKEFGYDTPKKISYLKLKQWKYDNGHSTFARWLKKGSFGRMPDSDFCENCGGTNCTPLSPEKIPLSRNVSRTIPCDPPEGEDPSWNAISRKLFECLCDPEMELSEKWHTEVLESLRNKMRAAFDMDMPDARSVGMYQFRACVLEDLISEPFEIPHIYNCPGFGQHDISTNEEKIIEWIHMDMRARKLLFELETMPCYTEPIAHMINAITKYYDTQEMAPPEVDIEPESGIATLKKPFGYLRAGDEILIDTKYTDDSELLISAVIDLEEVRKDPKFLGYWVYGETMHIYCASERNVNSVYPQIESLNEPDELQELRFEGAMVPATPEDTFSYFDQPPVLTSFLQRTQKKETTEVEPKKEKPVEKPVEKSSLTPEEEEAALSFMKDLHQQIVKGNLSWQNSSRNHGSTRTNGR